MSYFVDLRLNRLISASVATVATRELYWSTTSCCFDSFNKKMTAKVSAAEPSKKSSRAFLSRYFDILQSKEARERYLKKLQFVDGHNLYEINSLTIWNLGLP